MFKLRNITIVNNNGMEFFTKKKITGSIFSTTQKEQTTLCDLCFTFFNNIIIINLLQIDLGFLIYFLAI